MLFFRFTARAFCKLQSVYVFSYFPFGFEGRIWDLIVLAPDHCLSFYFAFLFGSWKMGCMCYYIVLYIMALAVAQSDPRPPGMRTVADSILTSGKFCRGVWS